LKKTATAAALTKSFDIRAKRISKVQNGVYRIDQSGGQTYALKRMSLPTRKLRWIDRSVLGIRSHGYGKLSWRNPRTRAGRRLFARRADGSRYILVPWISGRWPSMHSHADLRACGIALAKFHRAARRARSAGVGAINLTAWLNIHRYEHSLMSRLLRKAASQRKKLPVEHWLQTHRAEILTYSIAARKLLRKIGYRKHRHLITLCHGDVGPTNLIMNKQGIHFIDFETLCINYRAYDLYRMIYNSCKDHGWSFSIAKSFLDGYQRVSRLEQADYAMLAALLRFPRTTYLLLRLYRRSNTRQKIALNQEFKQAIKAERKIGSFLKKLSRYSRKK